MPAGAEKGPVVNFLNPMNRLQTAGHSIPSQKRKKSRSGNAICPIREFLSAALSRPLYPKQIQDVPCSFVTGVPGACRTAVTRLSRSSSAIGIRFSRVPITGASSSPLLLMSDT